VKEQDAAKKEEERKRKKREEAEKEAAKREEDWRMRREHMRWQEMQRAKALKEKKE
jgi:hypothetical protein